MKKIILTSVLLMLISTVAVGQDATSRSENVSEGIPVFNGAYRLFPTQNFWTFIKLDTRNGKMWQVHFTIDEDGYRGEMVLNSLSLLEEGEEEENGRFTLYPTENIYNFLLLDIVEGYVYQVQWSIDRESRGVLPIY